MPEQPWLKHYPEGVEWAIDIEPRPVQSILDAATETYGGANYLDFLGRKFTYARVRDMADRAARGLRALGVGKGVKVGLYLLNCPQYVITFFAILKAGGTVVNYSPLYARPELAHQIEDSQTDIMVTLDTATLYPNMRALLDSSRLRKLVVCTLSEVLPFPKNMLFPLLHRADIAKVDRDPRQVSFKELLAGAAAFEPVDIDPREDVAVLQYTGGTTGVPKGAMLTHANLHANALQISAWDREAQRVRDRMIGVLPLFHVMAMTGIMLVSAVWGAEVLLRPRFDLDEVLDDIDRKKATFLPMVPTILTALINHPKLARHDLRSLRRCVSGGAPLPADIKNKFEALTGSTITEGYGLTESAPTATISPTTGLYKEGSIGLPVPRTRITIVDIENPDRALPLGEIGEICVSGPQVMKGYWRHPEATAEVMCRHGLRTGDIGYMDTDGFSFIIDRKKDMILVSGFNVYPRNVEEAIQRHPSVREVTVIGVPDDYHGEVPKAFVVPGDGGEALTEEGLRSFLRGHLGRHEMPREIEFRDHLPKTVVGKLSKKELVAEEAAKRADAGPV